MHIRYEINEVVPAEQFVDLLRASTLAERRPVDDRDCIRGMLENADLLVTAWNEKLLVGVARSVTDFHYACYLSDLAVHRDYQRTGIGKAMLHQTQARLGPRCKLILVAAPAANAYYERIGFTHNPRCWILERDRRINTRGYVGRPSRSRSDR